MNSPAPRSILDPARSFHHHIAKFLRLETGTAQHGRHHLVREQIFEARLIAAAIPASSHDPLLTCAILCSLEAKHVLIVTGDRKFRGN